MTQIKKYTKTDALEMGAITLDIYIPVHVQPMLTILAMSCPFS